MKCRIYKNEPNSAQRRVLKQEVAKEFNKLLERYNRDASMQILWVLHSEFGFGQQRLQKFVDKLAEMQINMEYTYELPEDDTPWLCEQKLIESGIDVKKLLGETNE